MIRQVFRLTGPRQIEVCHEECEITKSEVLVRPEYLAICAADRRYYNFERPADIMSAKIPMALLHEASASVYYDAADEFKTGDTVVIVPTVPSDSDNSELNIKENYRTDAKFCSSGSDGFMQSVIPIKRDRLIKLNSGNLRVAALSELLSVAVNATQNVSSETGENPVFGIWGDGAVSFVTALTLRYRFPQARILIFGQSETKLLYFSFAENAVRLKQSRELINCIDYAFECVGGNAVGEIVEEMISAIKPQGTINLIGVSEYKQTLNTRMILEKGLIVRGHSRSSSEDFKEAVKMIEDGKWVREAMLSIISEEIMVTSLEKIHMAFERDTFNDFKTVLRWGM